jgi:coronin-1B/1C/6
MPDSVQHIAWSISGDRIGTTCKDKRARIFDPRAPAAVGEFSPHLGTKQAKFVWLNGSKCMTVGFGKQAQREIKVWDTRCVIASPSSCGEKVHHTACRYLDRELNLLELDQSASVMMPFFDADINVVHMGGKGETSIKHFEITEDAPFCHYLTAYNSKEPQRGIAYLPKSAVSVETCEVARIFRLLEKTMVILPYRVPSLRHFGSVNRFLRYPCASKSLAKEHRRSKPTSTPTRLQLCLLTPPPITFQAKIQTRA